uniref:Glycosyltransferases n=1 Tax=Oryza nivara TaxID=4536 RepID=A0A0E0GWZ7_ORYNI
MASIRRPHSPAKQQHLLRHGHLGPFASSSPPSSPLRHSSSSSSPRSAAHHHHHLLAAAGHTSFRRPLPRFAAFFLLGSFLGLLHFLSHLPRPLGPIPNPNSHHRHRDPFPILQHPHPPSTPHSHHKLLIVVTPTRARPSQAYYLTRMAHTLRLLHDSPLLWIVVQAGNPTPEAAAALRRTAVMHRYVGCCHNINASAPDFRPHQINAALDIVDNHRLDGVLYFADEEGVYSLHLFHHLRQIRRFATWPVPEISQHTNEVVLQGPVCKQGQVVGWHTTHDGNKLRRFHLAMSGFAFNSTMLWDPKLRSHLAWNSIRHPEMVKESLQGSAFVEQLVEDESQMEGIPADCSQIMNWHVPFGSESVVYPKGWRVATDLDLSKSKG